MTPHRGACSRQVQAAPAAADVLLEPDDGDDVFDEELDELLSVVEPPPSDELPELPELPCGLLLVEL